MRRWGGETIKIQVKVIPSSSRDAIAGWLGEALKVRVSAPPERGLANAAVETVVAAALGVEIPKDAPREWPFDREIEFQHLAGYDYVRAGWHPAVIGRAIDRAVDFLRREQKGNGSF